MPPDLRPNVSVGPSRRSLCSRSGAIGMPGLACVLLLGLVLTVPSAAHAQDDAGDGSKTIILTDPDHPLNGAWRYVHGAGTVVCPSMTVPIPASKPEVLQIAVHDGGARLEITAQAGNITMQRVDIAQWESETDGEMQILRKTLRSDNAALIARAADGWATIYEGTQTPGADLLIRYIMFWQHDQPDLLGGHITSTFSGCKVLRSFQMNRSG